MICMNWAFNIEDEKEKKTSADSLSSHIRSAVSKDNFVLIYNHSLFHFPSLSITGTHAHTE